jgi:hypothetical protein
VDRGDWLCWQGRAIALAALGFPSETVASVSVELTGSRSNPSQSWIGLRPSQREVR